MKSMYKLVMITILGVLTVISCQRTGDPNISPNNGSNTTMTKATPDHFDTIIAQVINEQIVFVSNIGGKISDWEDIVNNDQSLNISFDTYNIEVDDGKYYLVGVDDSEHATTKIRMVLSSGNFYEMKYPGESASAPQGTTCTCSGCTSTGPGSIGECEPKGSDLTGWYCTDCSEGTCTKSTTASTGGVVSL